MVDFWITRRSMSRAGGIAQLAIAGAALAWGVLPVNAATQTWSGATNSNWATAVNWNAGAGPAPVTGDDADINNATGNQPTNYDLAGVDLLGVTFTQTTGSSLTIGPASGPISFQAGGFITQNWVNPVTVSTGVNLNGTIDVTVGTGTGVLTLNGPITGSGDINVIDNGTIYVNANIAGTISSSGGFAPTIGGQGEIGGFSGLDGYTVDAGPGPNMVGTLTVKTASSNPIPTHPEPGPSMSISIRTPRARMT